MIIKIIDKRPTKSEREKRTIPKGDRNLQTLPINLRFYIVVLFNNNNISNKDLLENVYSISICPLTHFFCGRSLKKKIIKGTNVISKI
jgi:hypothetical protein